MKTLLVFTVDGTPCAGRGRQHRRARSAGECNTDEDLDVYELVYLRGLPWAWERNTYRIQSQVEITGGVIDGGNETGLLGTLVPKVAFQQNRVFVDIEGGDY